MDQIDADNPDQADYNYLPNTGQLAEQLRSCLEETDELPKDPKQMFDYTLFSFDTNLVPQMLALYDVH